MKFSVHKKGFFLNEKILGFLFPKKMQLIGIGSVSADMKKNISVFYRIGRFEKWNLSVHIGIGRYEKKLIGRTLISALFFKPPNRFVGF